MVAVLLHLAYKSFQRRHNSCCTLLKQRRYSWAARKTVVQVDDLLYICLQVANQSHPETFSERDSSSLSPNCHRRTFNTKVALAPAYVLKLLFLYVLKRLVHTQILEGLLIVWMPSGAVAWSTKKPLPRTTCGRSSMTSFHDSKRIHVAQQHLTWDVDCF